MITLIISIMIKLMITLLTPRIITCIITLMITLTQLVLPKRFPPALHIDPLERPPIIKHPHRPPCAQGDLLRLNGHPPPILPMQVRLDVCDSKFGPYKHTLLFIPAGKEHVALAYNELFLVDDWNDIRRKRHHVSLGVGDAVRDLVAEMLQFA